MPHDAGWFERTVLQVLGGVVVRQSAIPVSGGPAEAAALIPAALKVLPERQSRAWSWTTCMLQRPDSADLRVVSGGWPEEFRRSEPNRAESIDHWFRRGPVSEDEIKSHLGRADVRRGFEYLVHYASTGKRPEPELLSGDYSLDEMLIELGHANHVPGWSDVPSMLETPGGVRRLTANHRPLVQEWAEREPTAAIARLQDFTAPLAEDVLTGAVRAQDDTSENLLRLPTAAAPELTDWHDHLAALLLSCYRQPNRLREHTRQWITPLGVLGNDRDLAAARDWLLKLGLTPDDDPEHFPASPDIIIGELNHHHEYTPKADAELALTRNPLALLDSLAGELQPLLGRRGRDDAVDIGIPEPRPNLRDAAAPAARRRAHPGRPARQGRRVMGRRPAPHRPGPALGPPHQPAQTHHVGRPRGAARARPGRAAHPVAGRALPRRRLRQRTARRGHRAAAGEEPARPGRAAAPGPAAGRRGRRAPAHHPPILAALVRGSSAGAGTHLAAHLRPRSQPGGRGARDLRRDDHPPGRARRRHRGASSRRPPRQPATVEPTTAAAAAEVPIQVLLEPPSRSNPDDDVREFRRQLEFKVLRLGKPKRIEIIAYGTGDERAKRLRTMLQHDYPELQFVSIGAWANHEKPPAGIPDGSLVGNFYFHG
nr:hypothetical protein GCM10020092_030640 [Actinoplanes digitatis]